MPKKRGRMRAIRDQLLRATKAKSDAIIWLAESQEWDFFLAAMYELHRAGHNLWPVTLNMLRMQNRMPCLTSMWRPIGR